MQLDCVYCFLGLKVPVSRLRNRNLWGGSFLVVVGFEMIPGKPVGEWGRETRERRKPVKGVLPN